MGDLTIKTYGDPVLRNRAKEIDQITPEIIQLSEKMIHTMHEAPGIGLAAPQVGSSIRLIIVTLGMDQQNPDARAFINPEIIWRGDKKDVYEEGCLSVPEITGDVNRWLDIRVRAKDINGNECEFDAHGVTARIFQHEIDHLDGILFVDRLALMRQEMIKRKLRKRLKKETTLA